MTQLFEQQISAHYARGTLERDILAAAAASGKDLDHLLPVDLAPADEFHMGQRPATEHLISQLEIKPGMHLLDVGCGLGGPARHLAYEHGCHVTGVDLTEEFIQVARSLAKRLGLADRTAFEVGNALALPFEEGSFDGAYMLHVGMNIEHKAEAFAEVRRVVKPGGFFAIYDVMREGEGELAFPLPWAEKHTMSFVELPAVYRRALADTGFEVVKENNRREFTIEHYRQQRVREDDAGPPPLSLKLVIGENSLQKYINAVTNLHNGLFTPYEMICRAR